MEDIFTVFDDLAAGTGLTVWFLVKLGIVIGLVMYAGFAVMIARQVELMSRSLNGAFKKPLKTVAWGYLLAVVGTLAVVVVFL